MRRQPVVEVVGDAGDEQLVGAGHPHECAQPVHHGVGVADELGAHAIVYQRERVIVERPRNPEHGDYSTNVAMQVAKKAGVNPRDLATWLAEALGTTADVVHAVLRITTEADSAELALVAAQDEIAQPSRTFEVRPAG